MSIRELLKLAETAIDDEPEPAIHDDDFVLCPHFGVDDEIVRTVGMVARFDTANEVTLDELRVELTYPADDDAKRFFESVAVNAGSPQNISPANVPA